MFIYYASAFLATLGGILYHTFAKRIPATIDPMVSIVGAYLIILAMGVAIIPFTIERGSLLSHIRQIGWVQVGIAISVMMIEVGFVMMYRSGWDLSIANVLTGVIINVVLLGIGVLFLRESLSLVNMGGIALSIIGVAMMVWKG